MFKVTTRVKQFATSSVLSAIMAVSLAACGGEASSATAPEAAPTSTVAAAAPDGNSSAPTEIPSGTSGDTQEVAITLKEWAIEPANIEVNAGKVRFTVENTGQFAHNVAFQIEGEGVLAKTDNFKAADGAQVLEVDLQPGTYKMVCDIIGHAQQGMVGTLTVK